MNTKTQAQKGFKTFILTLAISLVVFTSIYYVINSDSVSDTSTLQTTVVNDDAEETATLGETSERSVFQDLASTKVEAEEKEVLSGTNQRIGGAPPVEPTPVPVVKEEVLAGADVQESTVPVTGISGPTAGIIFSTIALGLAMYVVFLGPRKLALSAFERKVIEDLD